MDTDSQNTTPSPPSRAPLMLTLPQAVPTEEWYVVEKFIHRRGAYILVKWEGYPPSANTWEPEARLMEDLDETTFNGFVSKMLE